MFESLQGRIKSESLIILKMNIKKHLNHKIYIKILRNMSPQKRLLKAFELSDFSKKLFIHGLKNRFPDLSDEELKKLLIERIDKCHNRNY